MLMITPRLQLAIDLASRLHVGQTRRDIQKTPYISHLFAVMLLASEVTKDEDVLISALLHDSLEDVKGFDQSELREAMGERVSTIVFHVTEPYMAEKIASEQMPWLERKQAYLERVKEGPVESAIVSCADKVHNLSTFIRDYKKDGELFLNNFHGSVKNQLYFYELVLATLGKKLEKDNVLLVRLDSLHDEAKELFKNHD